MHSLSLHTPRRCTHLAMVCLVLVPAVVLAPSIAHPAAAVSRANLLPNPSFEQSTSGWVSWQGTVSRIADVHAPDGGWVGQVAPRSLTQGPRYTIETWPYPGSVAAAGQTFTAAASVAAASSSAQLKPARLVLRETRQGQFVHAWSSATIGISTGYQRITVSGQAVSAGDRIGLYIVQGRAVLTDRFDVDALSLVATTAPTPTPTPTPGNTWTAVSSPNDPASNYNWFFDVGCASQSSCLAVGTQGTTALVGHWDGTAWSAVSPVPFDGTLSSIACPSSTLCIGVGDQPATPSPGTTSYAPLIEKWDGTSWAA
jgi:hypothetical protein